MKIAVVDDEALERKALQKMIRDHLPAVEVIAEAANGREAVEAADQYKPDVMLMDIKMPGIDGLEAIELIRRKHPDIKFIIVSAFDTFDYAKQAMRHGVKEYLLKPSRKEEVIGALRRVYDELMEERRKEEENRELQQRVHQLQKLVEKEWLSVLMLEEVSSEEWKRWEALLPFSIDSGMFMVIQFPNGGKREDWKRWIERMLGEKAVVRYVIGKMMDGQMPVLFFTDIVDQSFTWKPLIQSLSLELIQQFEQQYGQALYIGLGSPASRLEELHHSYYEALAAVQYYASQKKAKGGFVPKKAVLAAVAEHTEREKRLLDVVRQGDLEQALLQCLLYIEEVATHHPFAVVQQKLEETFILLGRMLADFGIAYERATTFHSCRSLEELKKIAAEQLRHMVYHIQAWRHQQANGKLGKAKDYIDEHYHHPLTLEEVAEYVGISPYYFSKLFKDRFGMTFIDYVTDVRIARAKKEMANPNKSLKEICFLVGYNDPNYFSRVFKKHTGMSPSEYRKKLHLAT
ncbi:AraC family transcriptional regulator [Parageobacillus genomosp. 1]|uniref:AraC family transcriptional regulator n=1 Tax=Parageobacillus genomosp. 1 TaxID=1295642 RepID=A0ABC9VAV3_9BACL|nr:response regulator transcription factor [Parageobacillus genomosp. 1]EZP75173.1 AraC family transcriptional regulator [Parageobacillus genomosp. 1]